MDAEGRERIIAQAREVMVYVCAARPKLKQHELASICRPDRGEGWTTEQEDWAARDVGVCEDAGRFQLALEQMSKSHLEKLVKASKVCMRIFRMTPIELLSPRFGLVYCKGRHGDGRSSGTRSAATQYPSLFPQIFLDKLYMMLLHPMFAQRLTPYFLVFVLQFTSICRTQDQRCWQLPELENFRGDVHITAMREHLRSAPVNSQGELGFHPSHVLRETSLLLRIIDVALQGKATGELAAVNEHGATQYSVYLADIENICSALSLVSPPQVSVKEAATIWQQIHPGGSHTGYPSVTTIINDITESYKHQKTWQLLKRHFSTNEMPLDVGTGTPSAAPNKSTASDLNSRPCSNVPSQTSEAPSLPERSHTSSGMSADTSGFAPIALPEANNSPSDIAPSDLTGSSDDLDASGYQKSWIPPPGWTESPPDSWPTI
ncbi:unnamed protein product [Clonostachys rhizophaga]|uniref:Uncharacterized protein n=1 Tax=Clonostachys rhizophaga TaxID=160324 RepID=A0A9N9V5X4_9HYPO|nr:unnamed protein product [Clonostachys rhizophaga]